MRIKICGIKDLQQAISIERLGIETMGFICVKNSPRYIKPSEIKDIVKVLSTSTRKIGVFVNEDLSTIIEIIRQTGFTGIQLHGDETPNHCQKLRQLLPNVEIIKAFRYQNPDSLTVLGDYLPVIDTILLDAFQVGVYGGTGKTLNWLQLADFQPSRPWLLAGGLNPDNVVEALKVVKCDGIDLSSGVEISAGNKDLSKIQLLLNNLKN